MVVGVPLPPPRNPETGFLYFRARYYDPATGRFISRDPVWDPGNVGNQYTFCGNNPVTGRDPSGEFAWFLVLGLGFLGGMELTGQVAAGMTGDPGLEVAPSQQIWHWASGGSVYGGPGGAFQQAQYSGGERWAEGARGVSAVLAPFAIAGLGGRALLAADAGLNIGLGAYDTSQGHTIMGPLQVGLGLAGLGGLRSPAGVRAHSFDPLGVRLFDEARVVDEAVAFRQVREMAEDFRPHSRVPFHEAYVPKSMEPELAGAASVRPGQMGSVQMGVKAFQGKHISARGVFAHEMIELNYGHLFLGNRFRWFQPFREGAVDITAALRYRKVLSRQDQWGLVRNALARVFQ